MARPNPTLPELSEQDIERFWSKVDKRGPDECWPWKQGADRRGYGKFWLAGYNVRAPRVAYKLHHGEDPLDLLIRHRCDYPPCCNGAHLLKGTDKDNARDAMERNRVAKGNDNGSRKYPERMKRGEDHYDHRLTVEIVREIRKLHPPGSLKRGDAAKIGRQHGITGYAVKKIVEYISWKHVVSPS